MQGGEGRMQDVWGPRRAQQQEQGARWGRHGVGQAAGCCRSSNGQRVGCAQHRHADEVALGRRARGTKSRAPRGHGAKPPIRGTAGTGALPAGAARGKGGGTEHPGVGAAGALWHWFGSVGSTWDAPAAAPARSGSEQGQSRCGGHVAEGGSGQPPGPPRPPTHPPARSGLRSGCSGSAACGFRRGRCPGSTSPCRDSLPVTGPPRRPPRRRCCCWSCRCWSCRCCTGPRRWRSRSGHR